MQTDLTERTMSKKKSFLINFFPSEKKHNTQKNIKKQIITVTKKFTYAIKMLKINKILLKHCYCHIVAIQKALI